MTSDLQRAFGFQGRVLLALMLREARTRYGRQRAGYLWAIAEPIIHIVGFYFLFAFRGRSLALGDNLFVFLASGFALFLGFRNVMMRTSGGFASNESLLTYPVVRLMDVFLGRALLEFATWFVVIFIIFSGIILTGYGEFPRNILVMLAAILALFSMAFGVGLTLGIITEFVPSVGSFLSVPMRFLYFTSALFYLPDSMPPVVRDILVWNPVLHGITLFREGYFHGYQSYVLDVNYLVSWAVGSVLLAFVLERVFRKPLRNIA